MEASLPAPAVDQLGNLADLLVLLGAQVLLFLFLLMLKVGELLVECLKSLGNFL